MPEFTSVRTKVHTLATDIQVLDSDRRGGAGVSVKNANASGGNTVYIGPKSNDGVPLSATTGYPLAPGESWSTDFTFTTPAPGDESELSVIGTTNDKVACIFLMP